MDLLLPICLYLDDQDMKVLTLICSSMYKKMKKLHLDQNFWFLRTQMLVGQTLECKCAQWREIYHCIRRLILGTRWQSPSDASIGEESILIYLHSSHSIEPGNALEIAVREGYLESTRAILSAYPQLSIDNIFQIACENERHSIISLLLLDKHVHPEYDDSRALRNACLCGHIQVVSILLQDGRSDPGCLYDRCIRECVQRNHIDIIRLLLSDPRVLPDNSSEWCLRVACQNNNVEILRLLISDRQWNISHNVLLRLIANARELGRSEIVHLLLEDGRCVQRIEDDS